jgi:tetratricopeptide (TPR) repeat protein
MFILGWGYLYWKSHQYEEASRGFEAQLAVDSGNAQAMAYLGDIELRNGNTEEALALLRKATTLNGNLRLAFVDLGVILTEQKNTTKHWRHCCARKNWILHNRMCITARALVSGDGQNRGGTEADGSREGTTREG